MVQVINLKMVEKGWEKIAIYTGPAHKYLSIDLTNNKLEDTKLSIETQTEDNE